MSNSVETKLAEELTRVAEMMTKWAENKDHYAPIVSLIENGIGECRMTYTSLDISLTGSYGLLLGVITQLEEMGYALTLQLPEKTQTYFGAFMRRSPDIAPVYIAWSNSYCERVQVGTEMVEQPVYEVRCSDA